MFYKQLEEFIHMNITANQSENKEWKELKLRNHSVYAIVAIEYNKNSPVLKEELNSFFNFRLVKNIQLRIEEMFTLNNETKTKYFNPYLHNKMIPVNTFLEEELAVDKKQIYLVSTNNSFESIDYGYLTPDNKLVLLNTILKTEKIPKPTLLSINQNVLETKWNIADYKPLTNSQKLLLKLHR